MRNLLKKVIMIGLAIVLPLSNTPVSIVAEELTDVEINQNNDDANLEQSQEEGVFNEDVIETEPEVKEDEDIDTGVDVNTDGIVSNNESKLTRSVKQQTSQLVDVTITNIDILETYWDEVWSEEVTGKVYDGNSSITANVTVGSADGNYTETVNDVQVEICDVNGNLKTDYDSLNFYNHVKTDINNLTLQNFNTNLYSKVGSTNNVYSVDDIDIKQKTIDLKVTVKSKVYNYDNSVIVESVDFVDTSQFIDEKDKPNISLSIFAFNTVSLEDPADAEVEYSKASAFYDFSLDWGNYTPNVEVSIANNDKTNIITRNSLLNFPTQVKVESGNPDGKFMPDATLTASIDTSSISLPQEIKDATSDDVDVIMNNILTNDIVYQWYRDDAIISGAIDSQYTVTTVDVGHTISCKVSVAKNFDNVATSDKYDVTVDGKEIIKGTIDVSSTVQDEKYTVGSELTLDFAIDSSQNTAQPNIQWYRAGVAIPNATTKTYRLVKADFGKILSVKVVDNSSTYGGSLTKTITIKPIKPDVVKSISVTPNYNTGKLKIDWDKPDFNGGSSITMYQIEYSYAGSSTSTGIPIYGEDNTSHEIKVSDLFPGKEVKVTIKASNIADFSDGVSKTITIPKYTVATNDQLVKISGVATSYAATGSQIKPSVTVNFGSILVDTSHYDVSYGTNTDAGNGTVTITFKGGSFEGNIVKSFTIVQTQPKISAPKITPTDIVYDTDKIALNEDFGAAELTDASSPTGPTYYVYTMDTSSPSNLTPTGDNLPKEAGTYYLWAYFAGDTNNAPAWSTDSLKVEIQKAKLDDTRTPSPTVGVSLKYKNDLKLSDAILSSPLHSYGTFSWKEESIPLVVGDNSVKIIFTPNKEYEKNYDFSLVTLVRDMTVTVAKGEYVGKILIENVKQGAQPKPQVDPIPDGASVSYRYKLQGEADSAYTTSIPTNAKVGATYICQASVSNANNYEDKNITASFTILEKDVEPVKPSAPAWDDGGPFTTDKCGNIFDRWGNEIYKAPVCQVPSGYKVPNTGVK